MKKLLVFGVCMSCGSTNGIDNIVPQDAGQTEQSRTEDCPDVDINTELDTAQLLFVWRTAHAYEFDFYLGGYTEDWPFEIGLTVQRLSFSIACYSEVDVSVFEREFYLISDVDQHIGQQSIRLDISGVEEDIQHCTANVVGWCTEPSGPFCWRAVDVHWQTGEGIVSGEMYIGFDSGDMHRARVERDYQDMFRWRVDFIDN